MKLDNVDIYPLLLGHHKVISGKWDNDTFILEDQSPDVILKKPSQYINGILYILKTGMRIPSLITIDYSNLWIKDIKPSEKLVVALQYAFFISQDPLKVAMSQDFTVRLLTGEVACLGISAINPTEAGTIYTPLDREILELLDDIYLTDNNQVVLTYSGDRRNQVVLLSFCSILKSVASTI